MHRSVAIQAKNKRRGTHPPAVVATSVDRRETVGEQSTESTGNGRSGEEDTDTELDEGAGVEEREKDLLHRRREHQQGMPRKVFIR